MPLLSFAPDLSVLLVAVNDPASGQIVWTELYRHPVAREDADEILSHASRYVRQNLVLVFKLDFEHRVGQRLYDSCHYFNRVFLRQTLFPILPAIAIPLASLPTAPKSQRLRLSPPRCARSERSSFHLRL